MGLPPHITEQFSPFQCGDTLMPARGSARGQAGAGLPGAVAVPGLVLALPPVLRVPVVFRLHVGCEGKLEAVVKEPESKLAIALGQGEQVLIHILGGREGGRECREQIVIKGGTALGSHGLPAAAHSKPQAWGDTGTSALNEEQTLELHMKTEIIAVPWFLFGVSLLLPS